MPVARASAAMRRSKVHGEPLSRAHSSYICARTDCTYKDFANCLRLTCVSCVRTSACTCTCVCVSSGCLVYR